MIGKIAALSLVVACSGSAAAQQDNYACEAAVRSYNDAAESIPSRLRSYAPCVEASQGHDDCSSQFSRIRSAHSTFSSAVSDYSVNCRSY
jgi:hypothetical protein